MKTYAYVKGNDDQVELTSQRKIINDYAGKMNFSINDEIVCSNPKMTIEQRAIELSSRLDQGDVLIVAGLSKLGRSLSDLIRTLDCLITRRVRVIFVRENIMINTPSGNDTYTKAMIEAFQLLAGADREYVEDKLKCAKKTARAGGKKPGRPKGSLGKSKLDGKREEIVKLLKHKVSKSAIARMMGVSRTTLLRYIQTRRLHSK